MTAEFLPAARPGETFQSYVDLDERAGTTFDGKISYTIDQAARKIIGVSPSTGQPYAGWSPLGQSATVTYAYRSTAPASMPSDTAGFQRFNAQQIQQTEQALQSWSDVANIRFSRIGGSLSGAEYSDNAAILFGNYTSGEDKSAAFAMFPGSTSSASSAGDVWVNITSGSNNQPTLGNYGRHVLTHEIGHAIGLSHPGDYDAGDETVTYAANAGYFEDSYQYTVMSYFDEWNTGASYAERYTAAPQLDDIAAAQLLYGANMSTRTGDTVYGFNANADREWFTASTGATGLVFAVWDAGGRDTFDFSGFPQAQMIDLREGAFSDVGRLWGNVAIAKGAKIENAIGGSGADTITGNALGNLLQGGAGYDSILAGDGNDTLAGGSGSSFLRGEAGDDVITGGEAFDDLHGNMGADTVSGGPGGDWVVGGKDNDVLYGEAGNDIVLGNMGDDVDEGGDGADTVRGGQDNDIVRGGDGDDWLSGDRGSDTITGGAGADIFHSFGEAGADRILDFNAAEGDRVLLDIGTVYSTAQFGEDVLVEMNGGAQVVLVGVQLAALPPGWIFTA